MSNPQPPLRIAVQIYSVRAVTGGLEAHLALVRDCGFEWIEAVGTHGLPAAEFAQRIAASGVKVASMHVALAELERDPANVLDACQRTGCPLIVMPWLPVALRPSTPDGWRSIGARLRAIAATTAAHGVRLAYHNHEFEFLRYGSRTALEWVLGDAEPPAWEADLGWMVRAGADLDGWLDRYGERLAAVHAKDVAAAGAGLDEDGWAALGDGTLPWEHLLPHVASLTNLVIFEHDAPKDHERTLRRSRETLRRWLG